MKFVLVSRWNIIENVAAEIGKYIGSAQALS